MAKTLSKTGIATNGTITTAHVTQSIDALTGVDDYNITISGSLNINNAPVTNLTASGDVVFNGDLDVDGVTNLDVVDIDGAVDMASTLVVASHITASTNISASGDLSITGKSFFDGHITASSNISASGRIFGSSIRIPQGSDSTNSLFFGTSPADNNGYVYDDSSNLTLGYNDTDILKIHDVVTSAGQDNININGNMKISSHITASSNISSSGEIEANTFKAAGNVDFNGDLDVDGTTNLDVVDIDGAVDMASTLVVASHITASGTIAGTRYKETIQEVAAAGSNQGDAADLAGSAANGILIVTGADNAKGVKLPAVANIPTGTRFTIMNSVSNRTLEVYPASGDLIGPTLSDNGAATVPAGGSLIVIKRNADGYIGYFGTAPS